MLQLTRDAAIEYCRKNLPITNYLSPARKYGYICPICGSGTGEHGTGMKLYKETNTCSCYPCGLNEPGKKAKVIDVFDAIQGHYDTDFNGALKIACDDAGIEILRSDSAASAARDFAIEKGYQEHKTMKAQEDAKVQKPAATDDDGLPEHIPYWGEQTELPADFSSYYKECAARLEDPAAVAYLNGRGLTVTACRRWGIGFDPEADPANFPGAPADVRKKYPTPRIIIPTSKSHYVARSIDPKTPDGLRVMNPKGGRAAVAGTGSLFNGSNETVFIVEGWADAVSIIQAEGAAVALNSTSNAEELIRILQDAGGTNSTLILSLDNDDAGRAATDVLKEGLRRLDVSFIEANIAGTYNDANDHLRANKEEFYAAVKEAERMSARKPDNVFDYINQRMGNDIARFQGEVKTGFSAFDEISGGGLYPGLYTFGAISSLGKTTLIHQMADQMAMAGTDVLFFSLEQSRLELVSKSIARTAALRSMDTNVTSLSIRKGANTQEIRGAAEEYAQKVRDHLSIIEGDFNRTVSDIADYTRQYIRRNKGVRPVVIVDYLQVITAEPDTRGRIPTTKEAIDNIVKALKRLSRELSIAVIVISSFNRANYMQPADYESFKESGGIEYTSDFCAGLQLQCLNEEMFSKEKDIQKKRERIKEAKAEDPRKIELVCLKNRYGKPSFSVFFDYYPRHDLMIVKPPLTETSGDHL